jgi:hypothetical protein
MKTLEIKQVKIGEQEYPVKMSVRAMMRYENLTGHSISEISTLDDIIKLFFSTVVAGGTEVEYDKFLDLIDDNPESLQSFTNAMVERLEKKSEAQ